jgi:hypothetical protein
MRLAMDIQVRCPDDEGGIAGPLLNFTGRSLSPFPLSSKTPPRAAIGYAQE